MVAHSVSCGFTSHPETSPGIADRNPAPHRPLPFVLFVSFVVQNKIKHCPSTTKNTKATKTFLSLVDVG
jgi:hypothetical protein